MQSTRLIKDKREIVNAQIVLNSKMCLSVRDELLKADTKKNYQKILEEAETKYR